ncbi:conserved hypothetical protein [Leptothrix cholodnii SP-6]|uniref:Ice-binding protein C-terminal domain-containing protein n=1 Tax=Leptothrix cholodnii (strain ATCC 51168 / LMG 8142 / SP-6) TaxID=395495 RepID=B1Y469_LEPCP|nr:PEPxxWA-CTERM sorting domain-containing protein [Leptothrix cholodnii]ACB34591.1 conserved hypothetical protein [Leptothrix cholodnii SP-6]
MKLKSIIAAVALSAAAASSFAATETITYTGSDTVLGLTGSLYNLSGGLGDVKLDGFSTGVFTDLSGYFYHFAITGSDNSYELTYDGTGTSSFAWLTEPAGGQLTVGPVVSSVPEPETYAMLLAGMGVVGAMARRRKNKA